MEKRKQELRDRLNKILAIEPKTYRDLAKEVGLSAPTMASFVQERTKTSLRALAIIEKYVAVKEKELDGIL